MHRSPESIELGLTPNPWNNIANQFTPRNLNDVIRWSRYIITQSPTLAEVIRKYATYPITEFIIDTDNEALRKKYEKIIASLRLKSKLCDIGFDHYTIGNVFSSVYFPIDRFLICKNSTCKSSFNARNNTNAWKWKNYKFSGICPVCKQENAEFEIKDQKSLDIDRMNIVKWNPENIYTDHNPISEETEYYYRIPSNVKKGVMNGNPLFVTTIPWEMILAVKKSQDFKFAHDNVYHVKNLSMGSMLDGLGLPPILSMYSLIFYQALLRKANEAIATEYLTPLRVMFPNTGSAANDPIVQMSMQGFTQRMQASLKKHKADPNHILISPIPIGYQALGGEGRTLLVSQEIDQAEKTMLLGLGVSQELLSGTTNWTSSTVGLRLLENSMANYISNLTEMIQWTTTKIASYLGIEVVNVTLAPFQLTDNDAVKEIFLKIWAEGKLSTQTLFEALDLDHTDEYEKRKQEAIKEQELQVELQEILKKTKFEKHKETKDDDNDAYNLANQQAHEIAQQLAGMDPASQRQALLKLKGEDESLYNLVLDISNELNEQLGPLDPSTMMQEDPSAGGPPGTQSKQKQKQEPAKKQETNSKDVKKDGK